jgi:hypothetical protein
MNVRSKLECFCTGRPFQPGQICSEPTRVKHLSSAPLKGKLLVLSPNIRQGCNGLLGTSILVYYENSLIMGIKVLRYLGPELNITKLFTAVIYEFS